MKRTVSILMALLILAACLTFAPGAYAAGKNMTAVDGSTVSVTPRDPYIMNVIVFGRTTCGNTNNTLKSISNSELPDREGYRFIYADIDGADKKTVAAMASKYSDKITFCYGDNNSLMWSLLDTYGTVYLPVTIFVGSDGSVKKWFTGPLTANTIRTELGLDDPDNPPYLDTYVVGDYYVNIQEALDRINEIRYEACSEGVENPSNPGHPLKLSDYHPVVWSSSLEATARQRAAEAFVTLDHMRPNGDSCFSIDGTVKSNSEVLAWNFSKDMRRGLNQFYEEKADWVNKTGGVTGHYTSMINPSYYSVGLGLFYSYESAKYPSCLCGRFSTQKSGFDQTFGTQADDVNVNIQLDKSYVVDTDFFAVSEIGDEFSAGDTFTLKMIVITEFDGYPAYLSLNGDIEWSSSDDKVFTVDGGTVTAVGGGTAVLRAVSKSGFTAETEIEISGDPYGAGRILGDVDGDGEVTITDATFIQREEANIQIPFELNILTADADADGEITVTDATFIMYSLVHAQSNDNIGKSVI